MLKKDALSTKLKDQSDPFYYLFLLAHFDKMAIQVGQAVKWDMLLF